MMNTAIEPQLGTGDEYPWEVMVTALEEHFHDPDIQAVRAVYAALAAHFLTGQPVWTMSVAPPGSMKTTILEPLDQFVPLVLSIDTLTPNTFLSGQIQHGKKKRGVVKPSFLNRFGSGIITMPDFSTILAMKHDDRGSVLAQLRRIYDGHLHKEVGTSGGPLDWRGRITLAVAVTKDVDKHYAVFQSLGERFLMIRWHRPGGEHEGELAALRAMQQNPADVRFDLDHAASILFEGLLEGPVETTISTSFLDQLAALAEFVVRARTSVSRDSTYERNLHYVPEAEAATRLPQQFCQLAGGSARLGRRLFVCDSDMDLVRRVAFDCIPSMRWLVLEQAISGGGRPDMPKSTLSNVREDLQLGPINLLGSDFKLTLFARGLLRRAGVVIGSLKLLPERVQKKEIA